MVEPLAQPSAVTAGAGCPAGTQVLTPNPNSLRNFGAAALVPQSLLQDQPDLANDPTLRKMAALDATWISTTTCTILPGASGLSTSDPSSASPDGITPDADATAAAVTTKKSTSHNWSGFVVNGPDYSKYAYYSAATMEWDAPAAQYPPPKTPVWDSIWPGIGSGNAPGNELIQAGSVSNSGPPFTYAGSPVAAYAGVEAWYELYPEENMVVINNLPVSQGGGHFIVSVLYDQSAEQATFNICAAKKCISISQHLQLHSIADQAEWILERPELSGKYTELTPSTGGFTAITGAGGSRKLINGTGSQGFVLGRSDGPKAATISAITMTGCDSTSLAAPGSLSSTGQFQVAWKKLGKNEFC